MVEGLLIFQKPTIFFLFFLPLNHQFHFLVFFSKMIFHSFHFHHSNETSLLVIYISAFNSGSVPPITFWNLIVVFDREHLENLNWMWKSFDFLVWRFSFVLAFIVLSSVECFFFFQFCDGSCKNNRLNVDRWFWMSISIPNHQRKVIGCWMLFGLLKIEKIFFFYFWIWFRSE